MTKIRFPLFSSIKKIILIDKTQSLIYGGIPTLIISYYVYKNGLLYSYVRWDTQIIMLISILISYVLYTYINFYTLKFLEKSKITEWKISCEKKYPHPFNYKIFNGFLWVTRKITGVSIWVFLVIYLDLLNSEFLFYVTDLPDYILFPCSSIELMNTQQQIEIKEFWKIRNIVELDCN